MILETSPTGSEEMMSKFLLGIVALLSGCSSPENKQTPASALLQVESDLSCVVLGGVTGRRFSESLIERGITRASLAPNSLPAKAKAIASSDVAIILVDATWGPHPINREDIILCRQFFSGRLVVAFSNTNQIDDEELLELEVLEMHEILDAYAMDSQSIDFLFDHHAAPTSGPKGMDVVTQIIANYPQNRMIPGSGSPRRQFGAVFYNLTADEAIERIIAKTLSSGRYTLVFGDGEFDCELIFEDEILAGDNGECRVEFDQAVTIPIGSRFVIENRNHVCSIGTLGE